EGARGRRCQGDRHLRQGLRAGSAVLRLLSLAAGLSRCVQRQHDLVCVDTRERVLPFLRESERDACALSGNYGRANLRAMSDLWTACALVLVIEGCLYALFPESMKR